MCVWGVGGRGGDLMRKEEEEEEEREGKNLLDLSPHIFKRTRLPTKYESAEG